MTTPCAKYWTGPARVAFLVRTETKSYPATMRLNGWQRIGAVFAVIWTLGIVSVGMVRFPREHAVRDVASDPESRDKLRKYIRELRSDIDKLEMATLEIGFLREKTPEEQSEIDQLNRVVNERRSALEAFEKLDALTSSIQAEALRQARLTFTRSLVAVWAGTLASIYALGLAAAWVRRGFGGE